MTGELDPMGIVQEIGIHPFYQMVYTQARISQGECDIQNFLGFRDTNRSCNLIQKFRHCDG